MSTCGNIGIVNEYDSITAIHVHWDSYPESVGKILLQHYTSADIVNKLMALGDLSSLNEKLYPDVSKPHTFFTPQPDVCVAYKRDRGEDNTQSTLFDNITEYELNMDCDIEYQYLFDHDHWIWRGRNGEWKELTVKDCVDCV